MTRPANQPLLAGRTRASPSLNILSSGGDNLADAIGKHRPVNSKLGNELGQNFTDQPRPVFIERAWGTVIIDASDAAVLRDWYISFPGYAGKRRILLIPKGRPKGVRAIALSRLLLSPARDMVVDHINGDVLDNRRSNLRVCTLQENNWNRKRRSGGASRFKGVSRDRNTKSRWMSMISNPKGGNIYLGSFVSEEDAARAYDVAARARYGEFAAFNFPKPGERCAALPVQPFHSLGDSCDRQQ